MVGNNKLSVADVVTPGTHAPALTKKEIMSWMAPTCSAGPEMYDKTLRKRGRNAHDSIQTHRRTDDCYRGRCSTDVDSRGSRERKRVCESERRRTRVSKNMQV